MSERIQEIVSGLRYCTNDENICGKNCPAYVEEGSCRHDLMRSAADLIESLQRETEPVLLTDTVDARDGFITRRS